ncbi:hypothetical protein I3843_04G139300 [Carya illinoinensis]|nr:hypothetical protein I3843_04G139300 [Carya illinoinensis]
MEEKASGKLIQNASASTKSDHHLVINNKSTKEQNSKPLLSPNRCIYKVPVHLHKLDEMSYTPRVISIGSLHHGNKKLQTLENYKVKYLNDFVLRAQTSPEDLLRIVKDSEERVRECYVENIRLNSDKFVNMTLRDAVFVIEYFLRNMFRPELWTDEDRIVLKQCSVVVTLFLFVFFNTQNKSIYSPQFNRIIHFVDLIRRFYLPPTDAREDSYSLYDYVYNQYVEDMYCASQLAEAGLIFKKSASRCGHDPKFQDGVLEIPGFTLDNDTELYARNLMALEQLHDYQTPAYITDYYRFLDFLIDTDKDMGLLRRNKILVNRQGGNCATIVNNLCSNEVAYRPTVYYELCRELFRFYNNPWNSWKIKLRRDFSTPWVIVTTTSAIFLFVLTLAQTHVCTVISTVK